MNNGSFYMFKCAWRKCTRKPNASEHAFSVKCPDCNETRYCDNGCMQLDMKYHAVNCTAKREDLRKAAKEVKPEKVHNIVMRQVRRTRLLNLALFSQFESSNRIEGPGCLVFWPDADPEYVKEIIVATGCINASWFFYKTFKELGDDARYEKIRKLCEICNLNYKQFVVAYIVGDGGADGDCVHCQLFACAQSTSRSRPAPPSGGGRRGGADEAQEEDKAMQKWDKMATDVLRRNSISTTTTTSAPGNRSSSNPAMSPPGNGSTRSGSMISSMHRATAVNAKGKGGSLRGTFSESWWKSRDKFEKDDSGSAMRQSQKRSETLAVAVRGEMARLDAEAKEKSEDKPVETRRKEAYERKKKKAAEQAKLAEIMKRDAGERKKKEASAERKRQREKEKAEAEKRKRDKKAAATKKKAEADAAAAEKKRKEEEVLMHRSSARNGRGDMVRLTTPIVDWEPDRDVGQISTLFRRIDRSPAVPPPVPDDEEDTASDGDDDDSLSANRDKRGRRHIGTVVPSSKPMVISMVRPRTLTSSEGALSSVERSNRRKSGSWDDQDTNPFSQASTSEDTNPFSLKEPSGPGPRDSKRDSSSASPLDQRQSDSRSESTAEKLPNMRRFVGASGERVHTAWITLAEDHDVSQSPPSMKTIVASIGRLSTVRKGSRAGSRKGSGVWSRKGSRAGSRKGSRAGSRRNSMELIGKN